MEWHKRDLLGAPPVVAEGAPGGSPFLDQANTILSSANELINNVSRLLGSYRGLAASGADPARVIPAGQGPRVDPVDVYQTILHWLSQQSDEHKSAEDILGHLRDNREDALKIIGGLLSR